MDLPVEMWNLSLLLWILNSLSFPINQTLSSNNLLLVKALLAIFKTIKEMVVIFS